MCGGQLAVGHNARAAQATVDTGKCHGAWLCSQLGLEAKVDGVFCDCPSRVGWRLPGKMSTLRTLERRRKGERVSVGGSKYEHKQP